MSSKRMKVVVLSYLVEGGMYHYASSLSDALGAVCCCAQYEIGAEEEVARLWGAGRLLDRAGRLRRMRRFYDRTRGPRLARVIVRRFAPSVVHIAGNVPSLNGVIKELRRNGVKVVFTLHDPTPHSERRSLWGRFQTAFIRHRYIRQTLMLADRIHLHSSSHVDDVRRIYPMIPFDKFYIAQHGVGVASTVEGGSRVPPELRAKALDDYVLFFGRIEPYKGLDLLANALLLIVSAHSNLQVVIAGAGDVPAIFDSLNGHITLINRFIDDEEISSIFRHARFVVLPYLEATQSGVLALAAAFGKAVVATRVGAMEELVVDGRTGIAVPPCDVEGMARAMSYLIDDPESARRMGCEAQNLIGREFSWARVARMHYGRYLELLGF
ncbi:MAG: glycosyltransferase family 4 protein [Nitrospira sp.]